MSEKYVTEKEFEEYRKKMEKMLDKKIDQPTSGVVPIETSVKVKKLPNQYNLFVKEQMSKIKINNPTINNKDVLKEIAKLWNEKKLELSGTNTSTGITFSI